MAIRMLLADVDGTLVTQDKVLTDRAIAAVGKLKQAGILFAITSGRPPRGMSMLIEPLGLSTPIAAFNGGVFARPDMSVIEQRVLPDGVTPAVIELLGAYGVDVWVYRGADWFVRDPQGPHVARETWTVKFDPTPTRAPWPATCPAATRSPPRRSPRSATSPTMCSCSPTPGSASPWATRAPRSSGPPAGSRHPTRTRASPTRWRDTSCRDMSAPRRRATTRE